jgi:hypothetical protein
MKKEPPDLVAARTLLRWAQGAVWLIEGANLGAYVPQRDARAAEVHRALAAIGVSKAKNPSSDKAKRETIDRKLHALSRIFERDNWPLSREALLAVEQKQHELDKRVKRLRGKARERLHEEARALPRGHEFDPRCTGCIAELKRREATAIESFTRDVVGAYPEMIERVQTSHDLILKAVKARTNRRGLATKNPKRKEKSGSRAATYALYAALGVAGDLTSARKKRSSKTAIGKPRRVAQPAHHAAPNADPARAPASGARTGRPAHGKQIPRRPRRG